MKLGDKRVNGVPKSFVVVRPRPTARRGVRGRVNYVDAVGVRKPHKLVVVRPQPVQVRVKLVPPTVVVQVRRTVFNAVLKPKKPPEVRGYVVRL